MTDFSEWAKQMNSEFNKNIRGPEQMNNAVIKDKIFSRTARIETEVIDFDIHSRLLPRHRRMLAKYQNMSESQDYDEVQDAMATVLSELSVDNALDIEFWKSLDEETGMLPEIFTAVSVRLNEAEESALNFRKD